ncbi:MAG: GAF domain-containing protein [Anaerolineae bacterium]|nr:GAF domain-containing protein [Anaerolineae bacterium]
MAEGTRGRADSLAAVRRRLGLDGKPARSGIARRMTRTFMLIAGLLILLIGLALTWASYRAVLEQVEVRQQKTASEAALVTTTYLARAQETLSNYGRLGSLQGLLLRSMRVQQEELVQLMIEHSGMFQRVMLVDGNGYELAGAVAIAPGTPAIAPGTPAIAPGTPQRPVYAGVDARDLGFAGDSVAFEKAIAGETYLSDHALEGQPGLAPVVTMAVPLFGRNRDGVLIADVGMDGLWEAVNIVDMGREGYAYIVHRDTGELVTADPKASILAPSRANPSTPRAVSLTDTGDAGADDRSLSGMVSPPILIEQIVAEMAARETSGAMEPSAGDLASEGAAAYAMGQYAGLTEKQVIGAAEALAGTNWVLVAELPVSEAMASARRMLYLLALLGMIGAVIAGALGAFVPRRVVQPILELQAGAREISKGHLDYSIEIKTGDELEDLAESFTQMAASLQASYQELEQWGRDLEVRVADRTDELAAVTDQMRRRADQLQISAEVAHAIASVRDLDELLPQVTRLISERFGWYHVGIFLLEDAIRPSLDTLSSEPEGKYPGPSPVRDANGLKSIGKGSGPEGTRYAILRAANSEGGQRMLAASHKLKVQVGIVGSVAATGEPRIALDVGRDAVYFDNPELPNTRSEMALPLWRVSGPEGTRDLIGVLDVQSTSPEAYDQEDIAMLSILADQVAVAIENAFLFEQTQETLQEVRALHRRYVEQEWVRATVAQGELAYEYRRGAGTPVVVDDWPLELRLALAENRVVLHNAPLDGEPGALAQPANNGDGEDAVPSTLIRVPSDLGRELGDAALAALAVPIKFRDQVIGVVDLQEMDEPRLWTDDEIILVQTIADQVALALENARLLADTQHRAEQLATLHRVGLDVTAALDLDGVLEALFRQISRIMDAESFYVALYDEATGMIEFPLMTGDEGRLEASSRNINTEPGITGEVLMSGVPLYVPDLVYRDSAPGVAVSASSARHSFRAISLGERRTRSYIGVPLVFRDQVFGVLSVQSYLPNAYSQEDVELLTTIATQASIAIQNARAYQQLVETAEQLREIDRLKTQFLANMSHELRTPLNSIIGFSRVMLKGIDGPLTDLQEADLNSIYGSGQHLLGLINSILDMSKIEAGKMDLSFEEVALPDVFNAVMSAARALVKDQPIDLRSDIADPLPTVWADAQRVRQVLLNLMSNAAKFTEEGQITLSAWVGAGKEAAATVADPDSAFVTISVADTGVGIDEEAQKKLFIPFQQVDASTTRRAGGTGLGLAISRSFVEMQGGKIWVESTPGEGATFFFTLPRCQPVSSPDSPEIEESEEAARVAGDLEMVLAAPEAGALASPGAEVDKVSSEEGATATVATATVAPATVAAAAEQSAGAPERDPSTLGRTRRRVPSPRVPSPPLGPGPSEPDASAPERELDAIEVDSGVPGQASDILEGAPSTLGPGPGLRSDMPKVVLVVDDDRGVVTLLKRYLETEGYQVVGVVDSPQAVDVARQWAPQLAAITLDIVMPRMDGWQVLRALKGDPDTKGVPVILCSIVDGLEHGLKMGADLWLRKPVTRDEILNAVRKVEAARVLPGSRR